jgi:protein-disulfide isomerase
MTDSENRRDTRSRIRLVVADAATIVLALLAIAVAYDRFKGPVDSGSAEGVEIDEELWAQVRSGGLRIGSASEPVDVVVFGDYQCPWCRRFEERVAALRQSRARPFVTVYRHLPLDMSHPFARAAAAAAECAALQGRFEQMHQVMFARQELLGVTPWDTLATEAGLASLAEFGACMDSPSARSKVQRDEALARTLGFAATPVVIVHGRAFRGAMPAEVLDSLLTERVQ